MERDVVAGPQRVEPEGLAAARKPDSEKWGFIDKTGKFVITPKFDEAALFSHGVVHVRYEGIDGYVDRTGKFIWTANMKK